MLKKIIKTTGIIIVGLLLLLFILPYLFPQKVSDQIKIWANEVINSQLDYSNVNWSFFTHFPSLTLNINDVKLMGAAPFQNQVLLEADQVSLGVNVFSLFSDRIIVNQIFVNDADIHVKISKDGRANYNIYDAAASEDDSTSSSTDLAVEKIKLSGIRLIYDDASLPMHINAKNLQYTGKGDLSSESFELASNLVIDTVDFTYEDVPYIRSKKIKADLVTKINTGKLVFLFEKNDVKINRLPVNFKGRFAILKDGYEVDFSLKSKNAALDELLSTLPPTYVPWLKETTIKGKIELNAYLKGIYSVEQHKNPSLGATLQVRKGYLAHRKAPAPLENLFVNFETKLPSMNMDSLSIRMDSLFFNVGKDYVSTIIKVKGYDTPYLFADMDANIDLEKWERSLGLPDWDAKGRLDFHLHGEGIYKTEEIPTGARTTETKIISIPAFNLNASLKNGYIKYSKASLAIESASFKAEASSKGHVEDLKLSLTDLKLISGKNKIDGYFKMLDFPSLAVDMGLLASINLADITKIYPLDSFEFAGKLDANIRSKGSFNSENDHFPVTKARFVLSDGMILTPYYPRPIKDISIKTNIANENGRLNGVKLEVEPISLLFEEHPFTIKAEIDNFEDVRFDIRSEGILDIGKIYQVFAVKGMDVNGLLSTDLTLSGRQSDAVNGNYQKLNNRGSFELQQFNVKMDEYPLPFFVQQGKFNVVQDQINIQELKATYGKSDLSLKGNFSNVIAYVLEKNAALKGNLQLNAQEIYLDELTAYASPDTCDIKKDSAKSGVVLIPENLNISLTANAEKIYFDSMVIGQLKGKLSLNKGLLKLEESSVQLVEALFKMSATYKALSAQSAIFDYKIKAENFDIQKAYAGIPMFRSLLSSAKDVKGILGLNYYISGKLDENMSPILPSLKGEGSIFVRNAALKNFKLMSAVSKATQKDSLNDATVKDIEIKTKIDNNIITLERTKIKFLGFRPRFEGQVSMDGALNLKARLGLPPFGILGIPLTVTGTSEAPIVKVRRGKNGVMLEETADEDDVEEMLKATQSLDSLASPKP
jgi:AsmA protein